MDKTTASSSTGGRKHHDPGRKPHPLGGAHHHPGSKRHQPGRKPHQALAKQLSALRLMGGKHLNWLSKHDEPQRRPVVVLLRPPEQTASSEGGESTPTYITQQHNTHSLCLCYAKGWHTQVVKPVDVLIELAKHPVPDEALGSVARVLLREAQTSEGGAAAPRPTMAPIAAASAPPGALPPPNVATALRGTTSARKRKTVFLRVTVHDASGHRTTACIQQAAFEVAVRELGSAEAVTSLVRRLYKEAPATATSRSHWVQTELGKRLQPNRDKATEELFSA